MNLVKKFWNNFISQPDLWFFYGFLLVLPFSLRKVLFFHPINGQFNEYAGNYLYLSDIFLMLTLLLWGTSILYNKYIILSSNTASTLSYELKKLFHLPNGQAGVEQFKKPHIYLPFIFIVWSLISVLWSFDKSLALFRTLSFLEFYFLYLYVIFRIVPRGTILRRLSQIIIFLGVFQAIIAISQFILQHSIGLFWLKESLISPEIPGVAKIVFDSHKYIRAYGLFPHPNILGGFLLMSTIFIFYYRKSFHREQNEPKNVPRGTIDKFLNIILLLQIFALLLTFSKSAILGLLITSVYLFYKNVPRGTFLSNKGAILFHVEHFFKKLGIKKIVTLLAIILVMIFLAKPDLDSLLIQSFKERLFYANVSRETILDNPIFGLGVGQFVISMQKYAPHELLNWQFQPTHNIFLLIWSELGIIGLVLFAGFLWKLFHLPTGQAGVKQTDPEIVPPALPAGRRGTITEYIPRQSSFLQDETIAKNATIYLKGILLGFVFIILFDHYLWDIQQGKIMFWLISGIVAGSIAIIDKK